MKGLARNIELGPLSQSEVRLLLERDVNGRVLPDRLVEDVTAYSRGNPLHVHSLQSELQRVDMDASGAPGGFHLELPRPVQELIVEEFPLLSPQQQSLIVHASVVGERFSTWALSVASGIPEREVEAECETLSDAPAILVKVEMEELPNERKVQTYEFRHAAYRDAIGARVEPSLRIRRQRALADEIERIYDRKPVEKAEELAWRFEQAQLWAKAIEYLQMGAARARERGKPELALQLLNRARAHVSKLSGRARREAMLFELLLSAAGDTAAALDAPAALQVWQELLSVAANAGQRRRVAVALAAAAGNLAGLNYELSYKMAGWMGQFGGPGNWMAALAAFEEAFLTRVLKGETALDYDAGAKRLSVIRKGLSLAASAPWEARRYYLNVLVKGGAAAGTTTKRRAAAIGSTAEAIFSIAAGRTLLSTGRWYRFRRSCEFFIAAAERNGNELCAYLFQGQIAMLWLECFDYSRVLETLQPRESFAPNRHQYAAQQAAVCVARSHTGLGEHRRALEHAQRIVSQANGLIPLPLRIMLHETVAEAHLGLKSHSAAADEAREILRLAQPLGDHDSEALGWTLLCRCHEAKGEVGSAQADIAAAMALIRGHHLPRRTWRTLAQASRCSRTLGNDSQARDYSAEAAQEIRALAKNIRDPELTRSFVAATEAELNAPPAVLLMRRPSDSAQ
jgi:hypothetical protein